MVLDQVQEILDEYRDHLPLTIRQIFYRLVGSYGFEKSERAYDRVIYILGRARRARMIPFDAIRDDGVVVARHKWHEGIEGFWDEVGLQARQYQRDRLIGQQFRLELWTESSGMLPQLDRVASPFSVPVYSKGGQPSTTANKDIADRIVERNVSTVLLHVGDYDPSGESIFESMMADVAAFVREDRIIQTIEAIPVRVALTEDQVRDYNLPTAPPKGSDTRTANWKGAGTCQLEALTPDQLAKVVEEAILEWIDVDRLSDQLDREEVERQQLLGALPSGQ